MTLIYEFSRFRNDQSLSFNVEMSVAAVSKKDAGTTTQKLLKESEKRAVLMNKTAAQIAALQHLHKCLDQKCSNFGHYC